MDPCTLFPQRFSRIFNRCALKAYRVCLGNRRLRAASMRLIAVILRHFFIPQFQYKRGKISLRVLHVDHELDEFIPFKPVYRPVYMGFTMLWITTLGCLYTHYGKEIRGEIFTLLRLLEKAYCEAGSVYSRIMTTTRRPEARGDLKLKLMQAVDPHLHCVPSLHVMIVLLTWLFLDRVIRKLGEEKIKPLRDQVYRQSVMIVESILFMKQHSVNCVPAGLLAVGGIMPEFTQEAAEAFIGHLFTELEPDLPVKKEVRKTILDRYRKLAAACRRDKGDYKKVLLGFIEEIGS